MKNENKQEMFCFQCQEAAGGTGCTIRGVCGKNAEVANLQYLLIHVVKGISYWSTKSREIGVDATKLKDSSCFITKSLFATITNANFDTAWFLGQISKAITFRESVKSIFLDQFSKQNPQEFDEKLPDATTWMEEISIDHLIQLNSKGFSVNPKNTVDGDIRSLIELTICGLKGIAAYVDHANNLGFEDENIYQFIEYALSETLANDLTVEKLIKLVDQTGEYGVKVMALLDKANTESFGHPEPTTVNLGVGTNPGILITGHDLLDLKELLEQSEGQGIDIYTHGEMLPANAYPELKKYTHLKGNYGGSWWHQTKEFALFHGPILFTTNCLVPPKDVYLDKIFVTGNVGWPGAKRIAEAEPGKQKDFSEVINLAKKCQAPEALESGSITIGFARNSVLSVADKVVDAIKSGAIQRFIVMAGCDGRFKTRDYYENVAKQLPRDTIILTAGCAKYRYNKLDLGTIGGIPRILDAGQCNDSYSLVVIALKLAEVFKTPTVNELPLSFDIAWYEQKAVIVLLALLHLGVKKIRLGPTLPAFLSPNVIDVLVKNFELKPITTPEEDIALMMKGQ